jgi:4-amino-4-deoxy-L-arabinose transferase-like glycosyltransferase
MSISRPWLAFALALFCLPLFVGLGRTDVGHDEAIYTFAVDRILEIGDWLEPKSSPHEDIAFLEKPPLKFWIVAGPIRLGLLPHDEFGLRFWDALFGAVAFAYVFAVGSRLAGPVCGGVALLILFVHWPLLFEHGLRSNNMEGPLFLSYCGGIFHFIEWARRSTPSGPGSPGRWHAIAVSLYFVLGFMTKFVAAIFLPMVVGVAALLFPATRTLLVREWRVWAAASAVALALIAPWFVYASARFGWYFWEVILAEHVYTRFRTYLNPMHVHPWSYYFTEMFQRFGDSGSQWMVTAGLAALAIQSIRRRWFESAVVVLWFVLPVALISIGTSKLYHYAYPFLPPLALGGGYAAALLLMLAPIPLSKALREVRTLLAARLPAIDGAFRRPAPRRAALAIAAVAALVAAVSVIYGPIRLGLGDTILFRSSGVARPAMVVVLFGLLAGAERRASRVVVALLVLSALPLQAYRDQLPRFTLEQHPMRTATECLRRVEARTGVSGLYLDVPGEFISHPLYYYFRRIRPWHRAAAPDPAGIGRLLEDPAQWKPALVWDATYREFMNVQASRPPSPPMVALPDVVLLLPGPYAACAPDARPSGLSLGPDGTSGLEARRAAWRQDGSR